MQMVGGSGDHNGNDEAGDDMMLMEDEEEIKDQHHVQAPSGHHAEASGSGAAAN